MFIQKTMSYIAAGIIMLIVSGVLGTNTLTERNTSAVPAASEASVLGQKAERSEKYTLYIGLNDKDTYEQIISTEDASEKADMICAKYAGGYTQFIAKGGWTNDDGTMGHENTLVYIVYDISDDDLKGMLDELLAEFNQSAVLVEKDSPAHIYYSGD